MYKRILIATDGSDLAGKALDHGLQLAASVGAIAVVVTVTSILSDMDQNHDIEREALEIFETSAKSSSQKILSDAEERATAINVVCKVRHIRSEYKPSKAILRAADSEGCDLIVMGSRGHRGVKRMLLGSQAQELLSLSTIPVLVYR